MTAFVASWAAVEALGAAAVMRYSGFQVVWVRYATHIALMLALWGWRAPSSLWRTRRPVYQFARSMLMVAMPASWLLGMRAGLDIDTLVSVFWLSPLIILGLGFAVLGEVPYAAIWAAAAAAAVGVFIIHPPGGLASAWLLVFPLGMALSFSLYVVMTRPLRFETTRSNLFYTGLGVLLVLTPLMPRVWIWPTPHDLAVMIGVGVLGYVGLWALDRAVADAPVSLTAPLIYLQIPFMLPASLHFRIVAWNTRVSLGLLIVGAAALCVWALEPFLAARSGEDLDSAVPAPRSVAGRSQR
jgi:drug/metabolite transporter (DMT)-like permease